MPIQIFTTGGTIDKVYFDQKDAYQVGRTVIDEVLAEANVTFEYACEALLRKDSLELDEADRQLIFDRVRATPKRRVVITHGTDTMVKTAQKLLPIPDKTIVLTGSMRPARFRLSDAAFNVGYALGAVQLLGAGVYIAINGRIFDPRTAHKNVKRNRFETG